MTEQDEIERIEKALRVTVVSNWYNWRHLAETAHAEMKSIQSENAWTPEHPPENARQTDEGSEATIIDRKPLQV